MSKKDTNIKNLEEVLDLLEEANNLLKKYSAGYDIRKTKIIDLIKESEQETDERAYQDQWGNDIVRGE